jgi:hypothetical protein
VVGSQGPEDKPFQIPKTLVWEAYKQVKRNKGAPGADGQSIGDFEKDLKNNLYKIWNRMSSGTYFPPPVRAVEIPKAHGDGVRSSACRPSRIASRRQSPRWPWSRGRSTSSMMTPAGTGRSGVRWTRWRNAGKGAGRKTGYSILTSRNSSTRWTMIS